jgi:NAD+ kinase
MKFAIVRRDDERSRDFSEQIKARLVNNREKKFEYVENASFTPEWVIAIGGDGTLLEAVQLHGTSPFYLPILTGTLGFYVDFSPEEVNEIVSMLESSEDMYSSPYPVIVCNIETATSNVQMCALNEISIRNTNFSSIQTQISLNGEDFEMFRGDGIVLSTPSGSTAFNKALGGAIIHPSFESMQLTEIGAVNNRYYRTIQNSILIPKASIIKATFEAAELMVGCDNKSSVIKNIRKISCQVGEDQVKLIHKPNVSFWQRVQRAFI